MDRCVVKNCNFSFVLNDFFSSPQDEKLLKQWQQAVDTELLEFSVCDQHFAKKDLVIDKNLKFNAIPSLHLNEEPIKLENDCCGFCLESLEAKHEIQKIFINTFKEICGYEPLTDFMCRDCKYGLLKFRKFKTIVQKKHQNIREKIRNQEQQSDDEESESSTTYEESESEEIKSETQEEEEADKSGEIIIEIEIEEPKNDLNINKRKRSREVMESNSSSSYSKEKFQKADQLKEEPEIAHSIVEKSIQEIIKTAPLQLPKDQSAKECSKNDSQVPPQPTSRSSRKSALIPRAQKDDTRVRIHCSICMQLFLEDELDRHIRGTHKFNPKSIVSCPICNHEMTEGRLEYHMQRAHTEKSILLCHICSAEFKTTTDLKYHLRNHDPEQMLHCDICGKSYDRLNSMKTHMKTHIGVIDERYQCKICLKVVKGAGSGHIDLAKHMKRLHPKGYDCGARVNSETNYFDCSQCGGSYADLFMYRRHNCERGRYQFRCTDCQMPIGTAEKFRIHKENKCKNWHQGTWHYWKGGRFRKK